MPRITRTLLLSTAALAVVSSAQAAPIVVGDNVDAAVTQGGADTSAYSGPNFVNREAGGRHWGDEIAPGTQRYDTTQLTVDRNNAASKLTITLRTMFDGTGPSSYADLFFDINTPGFDDFGYAIPFGEQQRSPGVYSATFSNTAQELTIESGDLYGAYSQLKPSAPGYDPNNLVFQYVSLVNGVELPGYDVVTSHIDAGGGFFDLIFDITSPFGLSLFDSFDIFWATADSGNDSIWGQFVTVPAPAALPLLGLGLFAFAGLRRRSSQRT